MHNPARVKQNQEASDLDTKSHVSIGLSDEE